MKGVKGKMMRKLKSIKHPEYLLKAENFRQAAAGSLDDLVESFNSLKPNLIRPIKIPTFNKDQGAAVSSRPLVSQETQNIDMEKLARELEEEEEDDERKEEPRKPNLSFQHEMGENKENVRPSSIELLSSKPEKLTPSANRVLKERNISVSWDPASVEVDNDEIPVRRPLDMNSSNPTSPESSQHLHPQEISGISFRRPDLNSLTLFDPILLEEFTAAVEQLKRITISQEEEAQLIKSQRVRQTTDYHEDEEKGGTDPLLEFEERCPPGGGYSVILYTTSLRGIRKTFEDCHSVLFLLESFRVVFQKRDISMHSEFREEMRRTLGEDEKKRLVPPRLFIKGRYIGGAEEVLVLHEQGKLMRLFEGLPRHQRYNNSCHGCGGFRFVVCSNCNGSRKALIDADIDDNSSNGSDSSDDNGSFWKRCPECNENGLIVCQYC